MTVLNITYQGQSADYDLAIDYAASDADIRRIAIELVAFGRRARLHVPDLSDDAFSGFARRPPARCEQRAEDLPAPEGALRMRS